MQFTIIQDLLSEGLGRVSRAVATRSTLPILGNVCIVADDGGLVLSATNLGIGITTRLSARVAEPGGITLPAKLLTEFVNALPGGADVTAALKGHTLNLKCGRYEANVKGMPTEEFPPIPAAEEWQARGVKPVRLPTAAFKTLVNRVAFAAATDESRPILTGVYVGMNNDGVTLAAADGFRLTVGRDDSWTARESTAIIPAGALSEIARLAGDTEMVELYLTETQALAALGKTEVVSQLIEGRFPDYTQIVPKRWTTRAVVDTAEMLQAVKVAGLFARDGANIVKLSIVAGTDAAPGNIEIAATSAESGNAEGGIVADVEGGNLEIAFNAHYLADALRATGGEKAALEFSTPSNPGVIRAADDDGWLCVVMPMHITA